MCKLKAFIYNYLENIKKKVHLLIPAAGSGSRMKAGKNKLLITLEGKSILYWTLNSIASSKQIGWIGIIGQPHDKNQIMKSISEYSSRVTWINGGQTRQESVFNGLKKLPENATKVLIHDGARCLIKPELINRCAKEIKHNEAIIAAVRVTDTIKIANNSGFISRTPERESLWAAQTPQGFTVSKLKEAHQMAVQNNWNVTDDASLFERLNWPVKIVEGELTNIKITSPIDLKIASLLLSNN